MLRTASLTATLLLGAVAGCKPSAARSDGGVGAATSGSASTALPEPSPSSSIGPADPVPGQYARYFADERRFSAQYPTSPKSKRLSPIFSAVEASADDGSAYAVICGPAVGGGKDFSGALDKTVGDGKLLSESHPKFYGTDAYEVHAQLRSGGERLMRYVHYASRFCSIGVELVHTADESKAARFIDSFRPEPPPS